MNTMKYLFLLLSVFYAINSFAQNPNPDIFQTWYLDWVQSSDAAPIFQVADIEPTITPTLVILENFDFHGQGACNSFDGKFNIPSYEIIENVEFSISNDDCFVPMHDLFEDSYFGFLQWVVNYEIVPDGDGLKLTIGGATFGQAVFRNYLLNLTDFELKKIKIYPNPTKSLLFINSQNEKIVKVNLLNTQAQCILSVENDFQSIDLSDLPSGIYMIRIFTNNEIFSERIIKN